MPESPRADRHAETLRAADGQVEHAVDKTAFLHESVEAALAASAEMESALAEVEKHRSRMLGHLAAALVASGETVADIQEVRTLLDKSKNPDAQVQSGVESFTRAQEEAGLVRGALVSLCIVQQRGLYSMPTKSDASTIVGRLAEANEMAKKSYTAALEGQECITGVPGAARLAKKCPDGGDASDGHGQGSDPANGGGKWFVDPVAHNLAVAAEADDQE